MFDKDVATGVVSTAGNASYSSTGLENSFSVKNQLPAVEESDCYLWDAPISCTEEQLLKLSNGTGVMRDFILVE